MYLIDYTFPGRKWHHSRAEFLEREPGKLANWNKQYDKTKKSSNCEELDITQSYAVQNKERTGKENTSKQPVPKMTNGPHAKYTQ